MEPTCFLTNPLHLHGPLTAAQLVPLVAADALVRRARAEGTDAERAVVAVAGDLAGQHAVERELLREGHDRASLDRDAFVERVRVWEAETRELAAGTLADLGIDVAGLTAIDSPEVVDAARVAFVRLYEEGLVELAERVVASCPRCMTVVDPIEVEAGEIEAEALWLLFGPDLEVRTTEPELLAGVSAVAVAPDHELAGTDVAVPATGQVVPVVAVEGTTDPAPLVPAHDSAAFEVLGPGGPLVLDDTGTVTCDGPLVGLTRFAARTAARDLLEAEGALVRSEPATAAVDRCVRCGTVVVPAAGRHWFLRSEGLEVKAVDAMREGSVTLTPPTVRDELIERAGRGGAWCLSTQVWAGVPVPVSRCLDCGRVVVSVEPSTSCPTCMGTLEADDASLDARFLGAIWALTCGTGSVAVVDRPALTEWALPAVALGLHLNGEVPFALVSVPPAPSDETEPAASRVGLLGGSSELEALLDDPPVAGDDDEAADVDELAAACTAAYADGAPWLVLVHLGAALGAGVRASAVDRVRALAMPITGA